MKHLGLAALILCGASACSDSEVVTLPTTGKADVLQQIRDRGTLFFEEAQVGEITSDFQFDGYQLQVGKDSRVSLETTHLGSSAGFDTTLFVYGPRVQGQGFGDTFIAMDNDSGFGALAKLESLELTTGEYLVVVGTPDALGRGRYRLLTTCESGDCGPQALGLSTAERDAILDELNFDCVFQSCDGDFGWRAGDVACDFGTQGCTIDFTINLGQFDVDASDFLDDIGLSESKTNTSGKGFSAALTEVDTDVDDVLLDYRCELEGYDSAARILKSPTSLNSDFEDHVLDCVFLIEDLTHALL